MLEQGSRLGSTQPSVGDGETIIDIFRQRVTERPNSQAFIFLADGQTEGASLTFAELHLRARSIAALLASLEASDEPVLLVYPAGAGFISSFLGCLFARAIAVPVPPPELAGKVERLAAIAADVRPRIALTTRSVLSEVEAKLSGAPELKSLSWIATDEIGTQQVDEHQAPSVGQNTLAFLQYTSGSTSRPRGVMVTHKNLLHNQRLIQKAFNQTEQSVILSWLPHYHDMGLIGGLLQPLYLGARLVLMSPQAFLRSPLSWLRAISDYKVTTSGGPDFAYDLCAQIATHKDCSKLDLSSWAVAFNGSEPVRAETIDKFTRAFEPFGFRRESFFPCYGLAEATLLVSAGRVASQPLVGIFQKDALRENRVIETGDSRQLGCSLASSGHIPIENRVLIVNPESLELCSPDHVGEIWVDGPGVAEGYYNDPELTRQTFQAYVAGTGWGPFLRTGDLGFIKDRELFVTGRHKDLIVVRGQNYHPQDIEMTVHRNCPELRKGCGAAFSVDVEGRERLVIVYEVKARQPRNPNKVTEAIRQSVAEDHQLSVYSIALIRKGSIPRTSSGKIRRSACRDLFLRDKLDALIQWTEPASLQGRNLAFQNPALIDTASLGSVWAAEEWLASFLSVKLGLEAGAVDISQPVSRYGLDSLAAVEIIHHLETSLGISISLTTLFESPSISELARHLFQLVEERARIAPAAPEATKSIDEFALSRGQRALYFLHQLEPRIPINNISIQGIVRESLDTAGLREAFQNLVDRHPSLRTNFILASEGPIQRVQPDGELYFREVDATAWGEQEFNDSVFEETDHRFDLEKEALLRVTVYKRARESRLLIVIHHIAVDFWSIGLLADELEHSAAGRKLERPAASSFSDYVEWQEQLLAGDEGEQLWAYWKEKLSGQLPVLALPTDRVRPAAQTCACGFESFRLPVKIADRLSQLSRMSGTTLFMSLAAAFEILLYRYSGQELFLGALTSGRSRSRFANVVGYFVNPVVLRVGLSDNPTFERFLSRMRATVLEAFQRQDYPFSLLVERLQQGRDASRSPLVQAMFLYQSSHLPEQQVLTRLAVGEDAGKVKLGETEVEFLPFNQRATQFDLTLKMTTSGRSLGGSFEYNSDLFDPSTIRRMIDHFSTLIEGGSQYPQLPISDLPMLREAERRQLLVEWNNTRIDYPNNECIHGLIEQQAAQTPDAIAVIFEEEQLSYSALNARANQLANHLIELGVGPESHAGICISRSIGMVIGLLGILKSGAAYVPLDPRFPSERLSLMVEDSRLSAVVTEQRLVGVFPTGAANIVSLDTDCNTIRRQNIKNPASKVYSENLAYILYTSGSTGRPKGVMVSHRNVVNLLCAMDGQLGSDKVGCWLAVTNISFDISVVEMFWTLSRGFRVIVYPDHYQVADRASASLSVPSEIKKHGITHLQCTPSLIRMLTFDPEADTALRILKKITLGGEALSFSLARQVQDAMIEGDLYNSYGPTETAIYSTSDLIERPPASITIGRPVGNTEVYILDHKLEPSPIGVAGLLYIGGEGVSRGYLNSPELTAEKFIPDPYSDNPGARLYAAGDLSNHLQNGKIKYLGRQDHQVKLRGHRIELGEIEAALDRHPAVVQSAALLLEDSRADHRLVAYVASVPGTSLNTSEMREFLKARLPGYMIPPVLIRVDSMPLTPGGKIDRKALPSAGQYMAENEEGVELPRTRLEEVLVSLWAEVLDLDEVGIHSDFFKIGGHSILASRLVARIRETFQVDLALRTIFEVPTIAQLAEVIAVSPEEKWRVEKIAELLISIAGYSNDEVDALLSNNSYIDR